MSARTPTTPQLIASDNPNRTGLIIQNQDPNNGLKIFFGGTPAPDVNNSGSFTGYGVKAKGTDDSLQITTHCPTNSIWGVMDYGGGTILGQIVFIEFNNDKGDCQ